jgi:aminoglycoside phosphotransferase (APT) family kinase protein
MTEWNRVVPGLVPDVKARHQVDGRESFLGQFLDGALLRDVYLTGSWDDKARATRRLLETLRDVWLATLRQAPAPVDYVRQIVDRLPELYSFHPELSRLRGTRTRVFGIPHRSLAELLDWLQAAEPRLAPKALVRIHGDLNTNNVIYDREGDRIHFIDVHRSGPGDYVQDIATLLVSNVRVPLDHPGVRADLERLNEVITGFARSFASLIGDEHVGMRLTLARARSFITSARLVADIEFARRLYLQGVHLLEQVSGIAA